MLNIVSNKNSLNIDFVPGRLANRLEGLKSGKVDCAAGALYTFERAKIFDFASFSYLVKILGVKRSCDTRIQTLADLRRDDVHVAVPRGGCAHEIIMLLLTKKDREDRLTVLDSGSTSDVVSLVAQGNADVAVADSLSCYNFLNNASKITGLSYVFSDYPLFVSPVGMIFPANKAQLRDWLTTELAEARDTLEFRQTEERVLRDLSQVVLRLPDEKMRKN
jgi:ABC-type amino acid transport substrate-binding protein